MDEETRKKEMRQVEKGRKAQIANEFVKEILLSERVLTLHTLETDNFETSEALLAPVLYLRVLKKFELVLQKYISLGEIAQREILEEGELYENYGSE